MLINCVVYENGTKLADIPVSEIGEHRFTPGELSLSLMDDYGKLVRGQL